MTTWSGTWWTYSKANLSVSVVWDAAGHNQCRRHARPRRGRAPGRRHARLRPWPRDAALQTATTTNLKAGNDVIQLEPMSTATRATLQPGAAAPCPCPTRQVADEARPIYEGKAAEKLLGWPAVDEWAAHR